MPRRAARRMTGRAALAMTIKKERTREHLQQMLQQAKSQSNEGQLEALLEVCVGVCVSIYVCILVCVYIKLLSKRDKWQQCTNFTVLLRFRPVQGVYGGVFVCLCVFVLFRSLSHATKLYRVCECTHIHTHGAYVCVYIHIYLNSNHTRVLLKPEHTLKHTRTHSVQGNLGADMDGPVLLQKKLQSGICIVCM